MGIFASVGCRAARVGLALLLLSLPALAAPGPRATGVRIGAHEGMTRFVLDLSRRIDYRVFTLCNPHRVVVDMPQVEWRVRPDVTLRGKGLVTAFRSGLFTTNTTRVVLDVAQPAVVDRAFILGPRGKRTTYRLVVDLKRAADPRAACAPGRRQDSGNLAVRRPPPIKAKPRTDGRRVIAIDPGHGGVDPGTIGARGTREKRITLKLAKELKRQLEATGRYRAVLTRNRDIFVRLRHRIGRARAAGAELFISLHADSIRNPNLRGASVYTLSERASDKEAAQLAAKENKADVIAGIDLNHESDDVANILIDLAQRESMNLSASFANILVQELRREVKVVRNSHRFAGFAVLKAPDVPSVLIELGYLSNRVDEMLLRRPSHRAKIAGRMRKAIDRYFAISDKLTRS